MGLGLQELEKGVLWRALGMEISGSLGKPVGVGLKVGCEGTGVFE